MASITRGKKLVDRTHVLSEEGIVILIAEDTTLLTVKYYVWHSKELSCFLHRWKTPTALVGKNNRVLYVTCTTGDTSSLCSLKNDTIPVLPFAFKKIYYLYVLFVVLFDIIISSIIFFVFVLFFVLFESC